MSIRSIKERLRQNEFLYGTWCLIPCPAVVNILAKAGLDFVYLDLEHGLADFTTLQHMIMAGEADGCRSIVRVSDNSEIAILKALESGADGVLVPHVETPQDRERAVASVRYAPKGVRGYSPYTRAGGYTYRKGYTDEANLRVLAGILVEGDGALGDIEAIVDDPELDFVYIGTYDISMRLGLPGQTGHPRVKEVLQHCVKVVRSHGKIAGCLFHSREELVWFKDIGIQMLAYRVDANILFEGFSWLQALGAAETPQHEALV